MDLKTAVMETTIKEEAKREHGNRGGFYDGVWLVLQLDYRNREVELSNGRISITMKFHEVNEITIRKSKKPDSKREHMLLTFVGTKPEKGDFTAVYFEDGEGKRYTWYVTKSTLAYTRDFKVNVGGKVVLAAEVYGNTLKRVKLG